MYHLPRAMTMTTTMKINQKKVAVISDLHLGVHSNSSRWHEIAREWVDWFAEDTRSKGITDIIFCGDWHHNRSEISVNTLQVSADILNALSEFNLIILIGNHDIYYKHRVDVHSMSVFKGRSNVTIIDDVKTITAFDRILTFCPWNTAIEQIPNSDIIFGHFEIESFNMNGMKVCEDGLKIKDVVSRSPLTISGHFHTRHEKKLKKGTILYCGNPFQMDFSDANNSKGYYILDIDTNKYEFVENCVSPRYVKLSLGELAYNNYSATELSTLLKGNFVKIKVDKSVTVDDMTLLTRKLSLLQPEHIATEYDIIINDEPAFTNKDLSGINIEEAIEEFINILDVENKKDILGYTVDLYKRCLV